MHSSALIYTRLHAVCTWLPPLITHLCTWLHDGYTTYIIR